MAKRSLAVAAARRTGARAQELDDLVRAATLAALQAVDSFDPTRGTRFGTYAWTCARRAVSRESERSAGPVSRPDWIRKRDFSPASAVDRDQSAFLSLEAADADQAVAWIRDGWPLVLKRRCPPENDLRASLLGLLAAAGLTDSQREAMELRYGLNGDAPPTLGEVASRLGVSRQAVSQRLNSALHRLRASAHEGARYTLACSDRRYARNWSNGLLDRMPT